MKIWILIQAGIIAVTLSLGAIFMSTTTDLGLTDINNVYDYMNTDAKLIIYSSEGVEFETLKEQLLASVAEDSLLYHSKRQIFVVTPTEKIKDYLGSYEQTVTVKKVIEGDIKLENSEIRMACFGGLEIIDDEIFMAGSYGNNIMLPENDYLIFCEKTEISEFMKKPLYRAIYGMASWLNLTSDYSKSIEYGETAMYRNYSNSEFIGSDQQILDYMILIKHEIINKYMKQ
jgi:hypothetical protein